MKKNDQQAWTANGRSAVFCRMIENIRHSAPCSVRDVCFLGTTAMGRSATLGLFVRDRQQESMTCLEPGQQNNLIPGEESAEGERLWAPARSIQHPIGLWGSQRRPTPLARQRTRCPQAKRSPRAA